MKRKISGLSIISCFWIALGFSVFIEILYYATMPIGEVSPSILSIYSPLIGLLFISIGIGLRKYQIWARLIAIILSIIGAISIFIVIIAIAIDILFTLVCWQIVDSTLFKTILIYSAMIVLLLFYVFNLYYLTRPKIKELFIKKNQ